MKKKIIACFMLVIILIGTPAYDEISAEASATVATVSFVQSLLETIELLGLGYGIKEFISGNPIVTMDDAINNSAYKGYCSKSSTNRIKYHSNGVLSDAVTINGKQYVINPILQKTMVDEGVWDDVVNAQAVYNKVGLSALAGVSGLKLDYKPYVDQAMINVASAISTSAISVGVGNVVDSSLSESEKKEISNFYLYQNTKEWLDTRRHENYIVFNWRYGSSIYVTYVSFDGDYSVSNNVLTADSNIDYQNYYCSYSSINDPDLKPNRDGKLDVSSYNLPVNGWYCYVLFSNVPIDDLGISAKYSSIVDPDLPVDPSVTSVGVYNDIYDNIASNVNSDTAIIGASEDIATSIIGSAVAGTYEVSQVDTDTIKVIVDVADDTQYKTGILGWLEKLWDGIIAIPQTILGGLMDVLGDFANWLFVPDALVLDNIMSDMETAVASRTGLLTYPISALYRLLNTVKNFEQEDCILVLPSFSYKGYDLGSRKELNLTELTRSDSFKNIYQIYLKVTDLIMIVAVLNLAHKKYEQMMEG